MSKSEAGRIGVWGASGSGKSSWVKQRIAGQGRVIVFDPMGEYDVRRKFTVLDKVRDYMARDWSNFQCSFIPRSGSEIERLHMLCRGLMRAQKTFKDTDGARGRPLTLVVEEMNLSFPVHQLPGRYLGFAELCSRGRHYGIEIIGVSQRMAEVNTRFRGNCTETVVFRQKNPSDKTAAAAELGCRSTDLPKKNLHYLHERAGDLSEGFITFPANTNRAPRQSRKRA